MELNQTDLRVLHAPHAQHARVARAREHQAADQLAVVDRAAQLLYDFDVSQIHLLPSHAAHLQHRVDRDRSQHRRVVAHHFRGERRRGGAQEAFAVFQRDGDRHRGKDLLGLRGAAQEAVRDHGGVDALVEQLRAGIEQGARNNHHGGGSVSRLDVLRLGKLDQHASSGVKHLDVTEGRENNLDLS